MLVKKQLTEAGMNKMLDKGKEPIDVAIVKWERVIKILKDRQSKDSTVENQLIHSDENCALCYNYFCVDCPLSHCFVRCSENYSAYQRFKAVWKDGDTLDERRHALIEQATTMLNQLKETKDLRRNNSMAITKAKFERFEEVRTTTTDTYNTMKMANMTGLTEEEVKEITEGYANYSQQFKD